MVKTDKTIIDRLNRKCVVCGKKIRVILYDDRSYRGGHYFGKIPLCKKEDIDFENTEKVKIGEMTLNVLKNDPKPYAYEEYWECPKCYWGY